MDFRIGPGIAGVHDTGQRDGGRALLRRAVRHLDAYAVAGLAVHGGRRVLRGTARGGHPRDGPPASRSSGPPSSNVPTAVSIDADVSRRTLGEGRAHGGRHRPGLRHQSGGEPAHRRSTWSTSCAAASRRSRACGTAARPSPRPAADLRDADVLARPALRRHGRDHRLRGRCSRRCRSRRCRAGGIRPGPAAAGGHVGQHPIARREGRRDVTTTRRCSASAIAAHRAIYLPSGYYVISDTLTLKPDTVLIGLHPLATQIDLLDRTEAFQGVGPPKADDRGARRAATNVIIGVGRLHERDQPARGGREVDGGHALDDERRAASRRPRHQQPRRHARQPVQQQPHGRSRCQPAVGQPVPEPLGHRRRVAGRSSTSGPRAPSRRRACSISDTTTEGRIYQMSSEHHVRYEVQVRNAANWRIYALQTEEERGEGGFALPLEIGNSHGTHVRQLPPVQGHQLVPAVPVGGEGDGLAEHPLPQLPLLQQQQGGVRRGRSTTRRTASRSGSGSSRGWTSRAARRAAERSAKPSAVLETGATRAEAGRRVLQHLRRRRGPVRRLLLRRRALAAHLQVVGSGARRFRPCATRRSNR